MRQLAGSAAVNLADSAFNAAEMAGCGYADVRVFPLMLGAARLGTQPDPATLREFGDGALNALCVGRCAPNKRVEHAIQACALLQASVARPVRFLHAGSWAGMENYRALLGALARDLGLVRAEFLGPVSQARLAALYRAATVFVCPSEHEGFCAPILEAMAAGVPVVARAAGAVPETLDGAGILVREPSPDLVAEILARLAADDALRRAVLEGQRDRMARYRARDLPGELRQHLAPLLAPAP
jgi:glycosyltransferase involved in cell wall biosynthesis